MDFSECENLSVLNLEDIKNLLPDQWNTKVLEIRTHGKYKTLELKIKIPATTKEEIKQWLQDYESFSRCTYSIYSTPKCSGIYVHFKQVLRCQHSTRHIKTYEPFAKCRTKNTNCPSYINITLRRVTKKYRGINKSKQPDSLMPCEIVLRPNHNHSIDADSLHFRRTAPETKDKLIQLFLNGHNPATALESLRIEIHLKNDNYQSILADRKYCPIYSDCYYVYNNVFKKQHGAVVDGENKEKFLEEQIQQYNKETKCESARIRFHNSNIIISIASPLFRRVHKYVPSAADVVFVDSMGALGNDGSRMCILLTDSACGPLPLGIIITSSESPEVIPIGLELLKEMLGCNIFREHINGPQMFVTDDSEVVQEALTSVWKDSACFFCTFHILRNIWKWLLKPKHCIQQEDQVTFFEQFKNIIYATSESECEQYYQTAIFSSTSYPNYQKHLEGYWNCKEYWAMAFCGSPLIRNNRNNIFNAAMRKVKENIFTRVKSFNLIQLVDFTLTKFDLYYKRRLLDAVNNKLITKISDSSDIELPPQNVINMIQALSDNIYVVPSENHLDLFYVVNTDVLLCTCIYGITGKVCKHINWACSLCETQEEKCKIVDIHIRKVFYIIATGQNPPVNWLAPQLSTTNNSDYVEISLELLTSEPESYSDFIKSEIVT